MLVKEHKKVIIFARRVLLLILYGLVSSKEQDKNVKTLEKAHRVIYNDSSSPIV